MARPRGGLTNFFFKPALPGRGITDSDKISFHAHITSVSDQSNPGWNTAQDMGRADPKVMYQTYSRNVNVGFIVVAVDADEHRTNYELLKRLGNLTLPITEPGIGYNAPHVQYRIGDLLFGYGIITSIAFNWDSEAVWIEDKPILTTVDLGIQVLTNGDGKRPHYDQGSYNYFGV